MTDLDPVRCVRLAIAVANKAVDELKARHEARDIQWFTDQTQSEFWLVAAGLDYDAAVARLRADGHFVPAQLKRKDFLPKRA